MTARSSSKVVLGAALATVSILLLGACGSSSSSPRRIVVASGGNAKVAAGANLAATDEAMPSGRMAGGMAVRPMTYRFASGLKAPSGKARGWSFPAKPAPATAKQQARLASALGLSGSWKQLPGDQGGATVLTATGGTATVAIYPDQLLSWSYSGEANSTVSTCAIAESTPAPDASASGGSSADSSGASTGGGSAATPPSDTATTVPVDKPAPDCMPTPPEGVPSADAAKASARTLFADLGYDLDSLQFEAQADQWGAYVTAWPLLDGMRTPFAYSVSFGAKGAITYANGYLLRPERGDEYPLVDLDTALARLNDPTGAWFSFGMGPMVRMAASSSVSTGSAVAIDASGSASGSGTIEPAPVEPMPAPADSGPGATAPIETVPVETFPPLEVTLTEVSLGLVQIWAADGTIWLLPAFIFGDGQGTQIPILAIDGDFLQLPGTSGAPTTDAVVPATAVVPTAMVDPTVVDSGPKPVN